MYLFLAVCAGACLCLWLLLGLCRLIETTATKQTETTNPKIKNGYWLYNGLKYNELKQSNKVLFGNWFRDQNLKYEYNKKYKFSNN